MKENNITCEYCKDNAAKSLCDKCKRVRVEISRHLGIAARKREGKRWEEINCH